MLPLFVAWMIITAAPPVRHQVTPRDITVASDGPGGFMAVWDQRCGAMRVLRDAAGGRLDVPGVGSSVFEMNQPRVIQDAHRVDFAQRHAAVIRAYPAGDPDAAVEHPVLAWGVPLPSSPEVVADADAVHLRMTNAAGEEILHRVDAQGIHLRVTGNRGPYQVHLLLPVPDEQGHVEVDGSTLFMAGFGHTYSSTTSFKLFSPYRAQAVVVAADKRIDFALGMQHGGTAPERSVIPFSGAPFLGVRVTLQSGAWLHLSFPPAGEARWLGERVAALRTRTLGIPDGPAVGHVVADSVALERGGPLVLRGASVTSQTKVFARRIEDLDAEFEWRQIQPEHHLPGFQPAPSSEGWLPLAVKREGETLTCRIPDGVHRIRVADGAREGDLLVMVGAPPVRGALFSSSGRRVFMQGELVPFTAVVAGSGLLVLEHPTGRTRLGDIPPSSTGVHHRALDTQHLRAGSYRILLGQALFDFTLVLPAQSSRFVLEDNQLNPAPFDWDLPPGPFGGVKAVAGEHGHAQPLASLGITALRRTLASVESYAPQRALQSLIAHHGTSRVEEQHPPWSLQQAWMDSLVQHRIGYWQGVPSRGLSFTKARTIPEHVDGMAQLLAIGAQRLRGSPSFGGMNIDVDTARTHPDTALEHTNVQGPALQHIRAAWWGAQMPEFKRFQSTDMNEPYHVQWSRYLSLLFPNTNAGFQNLLKSLDPNLRQTSNTEYNHAQVNQGAYPPTLYAGLDFTSMEAWADMRFHPLQNAYWTALADAARRLGDGKHPLWVQAQGLRNAFADHLERNWFEALAFGADGAGFAANIHGLNMYGVQAHVADANRDRTEHLAKILKELGPWFSSLPRERDIAILHSFHQAAHPDSRVPLGDFSNPVFVAFFCLTWAQYTPDVVYEESILGGALSRYKVLVLAGQMQPLPAEVLKHLREFQRRGGTVFLDASSTLGIPGARRLDAVDFSRIRPDSPSLWYAWERYLGTGAGIAAALAPHAPRAVWGEDTIVSVSRAGNARVILVLNNRYVPAHTLMPVVPGKRSVDWLDIQRLEPHVTTLHLRHPVTHAYDLLRQTEMPVHNQSISVDFTSSNVGWFLLTDAPVTAPAVDWHLQDGAPTHVHVMSSVPLPVEVTLKDPAGMVVHRWMGRSGEAFGIPRAWNDRTGRWEVSARELITGETATAAFEARPAPEPTLLLDRGQVLVHDSDAIQARVKPGQSITIVLDFQQAALIPHAEKLRDGLRKLGVRVDLWHQTNLIYEPMDWLYDEGDRALKSRIQQGDVIGERFWRGGNLMQSWKAWGTHVERDVLLLGTPGHNRWMYELQELRVLPERYSAHVPGAGNALLAHVWGAFSAHHHAVVLMAPDDEGITRGVDALIALAHGEPTAVDIPRSISATRARLLGTMGFAAPDAPTDGWVPALTDNSHTPKRQHTGPAVHGMATSADGAWTAVSLQSNGFNVMLLDGNGTVVWRHRVVVASMFPTVVGVGNNGTVAVDAGDYSVLLSAGGHRIREDPLTRVQWISADGLDAVLMTQRELIRVGLVDGDIRWRRVHHIPPSAQGHIMELVASPDGRMLVGPSWEPMAAPNGNVPANLLDVFVTSWSLQTGEVLWTLPKTHAVGVRFSKGGRCVGMARKRFTDHPRIRDARTQSPNHDSILTVVDDEGTILLDAPADAPLASVLPADDGTWAIGIPFLTHPWIFVVRADGVRFRRPAPGVVDGAVLDEDRVVVVDKAGHLQAFSVHSGEGWTHDAGRQARIWSGPQGVMAGTFHGDALAMETSGQMRWRRSLAELTTLP